MLGVVKKSDSQTALRGDQFARSDGSSTSASSVLIMLAIAIPRDFTVETQGVSSLFCHSLLTLRRNLVSVSLSEFTIIDKNRPDGLAFNKS